MKEIPISIQNMKYTNMMEMNNFVSDSIKDKSIDSLVFSFDNLKWIDPSGAIILIETIERLREKDVNVKFNQSNSSRSAVSYGLNLGVFQHLGLSQNSIYEEGATYLAPKKIMKQEVIEFIQNKKQNFEYYFEHMSNKISKKVLKQNNLSYDKGLADLFTYVIRELIRNIFDHSESEYYFYGSQFLPKSNTVELVISDNGVGLQETIPFDAEEKYYKKNTTENAIKKAFIPGITAASNHSYASPDYMNSGFGLAMVRKLILNAEGILSLATSDKSVTFAEKTTWMPCKYKRDYN